MLQKACKKHPDKTDEVRCGGYLERARTRVSSLQTQIAELEGPQG